MNLDLILEMDLEQGCYQCLFGRRVSGWVVREELGWEKWQQGEFSPGTCVSGQGFIGGTGDQSSPGLDG